MIIEFFMGLIKALIVVVIGMIPKGLGGLVNQLILGIGQFSGFIIGVRYFVPMGTLGVCSGIFLLISLIEIFISVSNYVIRKIPTID